MAKVITPRSTDYSQWYNDIVQNADLAEHSAVRGCMVIKPNGFGIWEKMKSILDESFKATGHQNAYFPLFIPKSFLSREAEHVDGFAKECAVVTHHRLKNAEDGSGVIVDPEAKLEEELIVRPTSETIIWDSFKHWIKSYRDLPLLINQWANVVRWELRTRPFLRTAEFLWQEGHTAHANSAEAIEEAKRIHYIYADFAENVMAMPVLRGRKSANERFAGALETYTIEALMQDGKALQAGTSHFLGQNFAKAFDVKYLDNNNKEQYVWATSWGVSTRLIGALIMTHSDDAGLIIPPKLAPTHVAIVPIPKANGKINEEVEKIKKQLEDRGITYIYDDDKKKRPGFKFAEHELRGVPLRIGIGKRDIAKEQAELARRDTGEKEFVPLHKISERVEGLLNEIQDNLFQRAMKYRDEHISKAGSLEEMKEIIEEKGGFVKAHWDGSTETELKIKSETKATLRCIPEEEGEKGECIISGKPSSGQVYFSKAY